ncbi:MAG: hypothetical protein ABR592_07650, partial [Nitriliruptorales bacterium]
PAPVTLPLDTAAGAMDVFLRDRDGTTSRIGVEAHFGDSPTYLNLDLEDRDVELTLPASVPVTLCGLAGWPPGAQATLAGS